MNPPGHQGEQRFFVSDPAIVADDETHHGALFARLEAVARVAACLVYLVKFGWGKLWLNF